jgi:hypothetical protein
MKPCEYWMLQTRLLQMVAWNNRFVRFPYLFQLVWLTVSLGMRQSLLQSIALQSVAPASDADGLNDALAAVCANQVSNACSHLIDHN